MFRFNIIQTLLLAACLGVLSCGKEEFTPPSIQDGDDSAVEKTSEEAPARTWVEYDGLSVGSSYQISKAVSIYEQPSPSTRNTVIPRGGHFQVVAVAEVYNEKWYEVRALRDGGYLKAVALNGLTLDDYVPGQGHETVAEKSPGAKKENRLSPQLQVRKSATPDPDPKVFVLQGQNVYHKRKCSLVKRILAETGSVSGSRPLRSKAIADGYTACRTCKPGLEAGSRQGP